MSRICLALVGLITLTTSVSAQRWMEQLDRGVVAIPRKDGSCTVSWRVLGTDAAGVSFNVYRVVEGEIPERVNFKPVSGATFLVDEAFRHGTETTYLVKPLINGEERAADGSFTVATDAPFDYLSIPLQTPERYTPNDASVGDLDGDGQYEIVLHQTGKGRDSSQGGMTDPPILQAYEFDGTKLWEINLGKNIREGAHYTQFMVYDLDGDGIAEVACKTADGTVDGVGAVIGDPNANWVNEGGRILAGPEFLTIFNGQTGAAMKTVDYIPARHPDTETPTGKQLDRIWGDGYGNRVDRFLAGVAYLDGEKPSLIMCRGYYTRSVLAAWNWREGKLENVWTFDSSSDPKYRAFSGQGNHGLSINDVDNDGKDEIVYGGYTIDDDGTGLYSTRLGHGDALHVGDLDPTRPGLEVFRIQEPRGSAGAHYYEAATGKMYWKLPSTSRRGEGPGRGLSIDIDPRHKGVESWVFGGGIRGLYNSDGKRISDRSPPSCNFAAWWDGDLLREVLDKNWIGKWDWNESKLERLLTAENCTSSNGTKATPTLSADLLGDWREEVIWRTKDKNELRLYVTPIPTEHRMTTLMHDPHYRLAIAWQNVGYNQPPHTGFYLGPGMDMPKSNIQVVPLPNADTQASSFELEPQTAER